MGTQEFKAPQQAFPHLLREPAPPILFKPGLPRLGMLCKQGPGTRHALWLPLLLLPLPVTYLRRSRAGVFARGK